VHYSPPKNAHKHANAAANVATAGAVGSTGSASSARTVSQRTGVVKNNGFNPVWEEKLSLPFDLMGDMKDLVFVRFEVREEDGSEDHPVGVYCISLGSLLMGECTRIFTCFVCY
jgi:phosphatidylinositol phospholipase C, delta